MKYAFWFRTKYTFLIVHKKYIYVLIITRERNILYDRQRHENPDSPSASRRRKRFVKIGKTRRKKYTHTHAVIVIVIIIFTRKLVGIFSFIFAFHFRHWAHLDVIAHRSTLRHVNDPAINHPLLGKPGPGDGWQWWKAAENKLEFFRGCVSSAFFLLRVCATYGETEF